ncbi:MAG: Ig-like domain-containing protein, partial [Acidobacteriota bacterium]
APNANYCNQPPGTTLSTFTYTLTPGSSSTTVTMTVTCVDDNPVAVADAATVLEDSGATAVNVLANDTDVDAGPISIASVTQPANGVVVITGGGTGLTYAPNANYCNQPPGTTLSTFTYTLTPGSSSTTVTMTVTCVDDNPVAVADAATVVEDSGANAVNVLANDTDVDAGPKSVASVTQPANGVVVITGGGTGLTYAPNANYCNQPPGTTLDTFTYTLTPGSSSTSVTMTVTCVDDPPVAVADAATVVEDSGANAINVLANDTDIDAGPKSIASVTQPANGAVVITGGGTGLTYAPNANYCNNPPGTTPSTFTYTLTPGGSSTTVSVLVTCVNDPPVAGNDVADFIGNTELRVDTGAVATPHVLKTTGTTFGVLDNDSDPVEGDTVMVTSITVGACTDSSAPFDCSDPAVGTVHMQANGRYSFEPAQGDGSATETFTYVVSDNGIPAPASATGTVTLTRFGRVWYVKNDQAAGGFGRSFDPFDTLVEAETFSVAGDTIYVYNGNGTTTGQANGIVLKNTQRLIGEGVQLTLAVAVNGGPNPTLLRAAGTTPMIDDTDAGGNGAGATDALPLEIAGLNLAGATNAIDLTLTAAFAGTGSTEIRNNTIRSSGIEGIDINAAGGAASTVNLSIHDNTITAGVRGIDLLRTTGTCRITAFQNNAISGNTGGSGIEILGAIFDSNAATTSFDTVSGGTTVIGASGNGTSTNGMLLTSVTGDLSFTDLDIFNDAGAGLFASSTGALNAGAGTGFRIAVGAGVSTIDSNGGPAVSINNASISLPLNFLRSTNSTTTGLSLVSAFGGVGSTALSAGTGQIADPVGASGTAVNISGGNGNITLGIPIINTSGNAVVVTSRTSDTVSISGAITESGSGISLTTNTGATINFSGGIAATTGTSPAFAATGGGTVTATDTTSTLTTTTATALNVANTTIGAGGLKFRSITAGTAASGPTNGIVLNTTGVLGGLTVSGTGGAGTGGTIQKASGPGVLLMSTQNASLSSMNVQNGTDDGIHGESVTNLNLIGCSVTGNGNATTDDGIQLGLESGATTGITGTLNLTNTTVSSSAHNNVHIRNTLGTLTMNVSGGAYNNISDTTGANSFLFEASGTSTTTAATISGATFSTNSPQRGLEVQAHDTATVTDFTVSGCTFTDNGIHASFTQDTSANLTFKMLNNLNMMTATPLHAINVFSSSTSTGGTIKGRIQGNTIGNIGVAGSGSSTGNGVRVVIQGRTTATLLIDGNVIRQTPGGRAVDMQFLGSTTTGLGIVSTNDVTVSNNDAQNNAPAASFPLAAIFLAADNQGSPARVRADIRTNTVPSTVGPNGSYDYPTFDGNAAWFVYEELGGATAELIDNAPASGTATAEMQSHNTGTMFADPGVALIAGPITTPP